MGARRSRPAPIATVAEGVRLADLLRASVEAVLPDLVSESSAGGVERLFADLSIELSGRLHAAGYAIHARDGRCVRVPPASEFGRPATEDELRAMMAEAERPPAPSRWRRRPPDDPPRPPSDRAVS